MRVVTGKCSGVPGQAWLCPAEIGSLDKGSLSPVFSSQPMPSVCWCHSLLLSLTVSPVVKQGDCRKPQLHIPLDRDSGKKQPQQTRPCKDSDQPSLGPGHVSKPITGTRASPSQSLLQRSKRAGHHTVAPTGPHVCERAGSPKGRAVCTPTVSDHHAYSSCILVLDI